MCLPLFTHTLNSMQLLVQIRSIMLLIDYNIANLQVYYVNPLHDNPVVSGMPNLIELCYLL